MDKEECVQFDLGWKQVMMNFTKEALVDKIKALCLDKIKAEGKHTTKPTNSIRKQRSKTYTAKHNEANRRHYAKNKDKILAKHRVYNEANKDKVAAQQKIYKEAHKDEVNAARRKARRAKKAKYKAFRDRVNAYKRNRWATDIPFRLKEILRKRLRQAVKRCNTTKSANTMELVGCDAPFLKRHLEKQFTKGMTWDNYGKFWHIDHIVPCSKFDLQRADEQRRCFHYSNLQPLPTKTNLSKGGSLERPTQVLLVA